MRFRDAKFLLLLAGLAGVAQPVARAEESPPSEYQMKAAYLYNFAKFVEWPGTAFTGTNAEFVIGLFGDNQFAAELQRTIQGKRVNNHALVVRQFNNLSEIPSCHILFIGRSERKRLAEILKAAECSPVLTISDLDRFMRRDLMVNFFVEGNKVRFEINDEAAKQAGLRISSKLLNLARPRGGEK